MKGFDDRRDDVLDKLAAVADRLTLPHSFIVTECYENISLSTRPMDPLGWAVPSNAASVGAISLTCAPEQHQAGFAGVSGGPAESVDVIRKKRIIWNLRLASMPSPK